MNRNFFPGYDRYINWTAVYNETTGKHDKLPVGNHLDPRSWKSYEQAAASSENVGFVFTESDPFFFIDIDDAYSDGFWSPIAIEICARFPGCAMEVSYSGKGLHIFGVGTPDFEHRNKNSALNIEIYTRDRFAALTGVGARGSAFQDAGAALSDFLREYFHKPPETVPETGWTATPRPDWAGPDDDAELLRIAMRSKSAAATFGGGVSFRELYEVDADALGRRFPASRPEGFDWSSADAALLSHLAFYTGANCERMERMFGASKLANRDKWRDRSDYRERSILNAASSCRNVYRNEKYIISSKTVAGIRTGPQFYNIEAQLELFRGCVYVIGPHRIFTPGRGMLKSEQFKAVFGGRWFAIATEGKPTKNAFETFTENQLYDFPLADDTCFRPETGSGEIIAEEGRALVNIYEPIETLSVEMDVSPFLDLLSKLLPDETDRTILLSYLAAVIQHPGVKFQWAPLIQGVEGNGKTFLITALSRAIGMRYTHIPKAADLRGNGIKFNGWLYGKLFVGIEELTADAMMGVQQALNEWVTNEFIEFQFKGGHQFVGDNRANFLFLANFKDVFRITENNRRYCPFYTAQQKKRDLREHGMSGPYFPKLYDWARKSNGWAGISHYLKNYRIDERFNPAGKRQRAPETTSTREAFKSSLSDEEQEVLEAVAQDRMGFRNGWISSVALDRLFSDLKLRVSRNKRKSMLENLGYVQKERMNAPSLADDSKKPVLYISESRFDLAAIPVGRETAVAYLNAQGIAPN
jgi:hypothetical protein